MTAKLPAAIRPILGNQPHESDLFAERVVSGVQRPRTSSSEGGYEAP